MSNAIYYFAFCAANVILLREVNHVVTEPYMDEPFHVPQAQAYCEGEWSMWDPKITTPPGLYVLSVLLSKLFVFKCNLAILRLTSLLALLSLPIILTRLLCYRRRERPPQELLSPTIDALALSLFPIAWFFGFLYYTDVPSLAFVLATVVAALQDRHILASVLGLLSCTFRQTNIIWVLYAFAYSQLRAMSSKKTAENQHVTKLYDPPALSAGFPDLSKALLSVPAALPELLRNSIPYIMDSVLFAAFVIWNGGIVLGDKSNHTPSLHIPQVYYFIGFATLFGWIPLISGPSGPFGLLRDVRSRMFGSNLRIMASTVLSVLIGITVHLFTIHHPFLLSDNRHYTFYVWRRIFRFRDIVPYVFAPAYLACGWAWFLRVGRKQTLLQTLILPLCTLPTLLLTPLLEPRYFLIPYILLRSQVEDVPDVMVWAELVWYALIDWVTMYVFLYKERGDIRFMW